MNFTEYRETIARELAALEADALDAIVARFQKIKQTGGVVFLLGNGGSAALADHLALHLIQAGIKAQPLSSVSPLLTAQSNDRSYALAPLLTLRAIGHSRDILLVISGSGDSANILTALAEARRLEMTTIGLLGFGGGAAKGLCDYAIVLKSHDYGPVEDSHSAIIHWVERKLKEGE